MINHDLETAFARLLMSIHKDRRERGSRIFLFCGCEPQAGTTAVAMRAAIILSRSGCKTLLMDADLRGEGPEDSLGCYLEGVAGLDEIIHECDCEGLFYIPGGGAQVNPAGLLCGSNMRLLLEQLRKKFDAVLIDAPAVGAAVDAEILGAMADGTVLAAAWEQTAVDRVVIAKKAMEGAGARIMGILLNRVDAASYRYLSRDQSYLSRKDRGREYGRPVSKRKSLW